VDENEMRERMLAALEDGKVCDLAADDGERQETVEVAASLLREVLLTVENVDRRRGARFRRLAVSGRFVLAGCLLRFPLEFERCDFGDVDVARTRLRSLTFRRCTLGDLDADRSRCFGSLDLKGCNLASLSLRGATLQGSLRLDRCKIRGAEIETPAAFKIREAVRAEGVTVGGEVTMRFLHAGATVNFRRSLLRQRFYALGACLDGGGGLALRLEEAKVERNVDLKFGFTAKGGVHMGRVRIGGNLDCRGACLEVSAALADMRDALDAHDARVGGDVMLKAGIDGGGKLHGFESHGRVNLHRARIDGSLECHGASFETLGLRGREPKRAFDGEELQVAASALFKVYDPGEDSNRRFRKAGGAEPRPMRCRSSGAISLRRARIGRRLSCSGADLNAAGVGRLALLADDAVVERNVDLRRDGRCGMSFTAHGTVDLDRIAIGGSLDCGGGQFVADERSFSESSGPSETPPHQQRTRALAVRDGRIAGSVYLCAPKRSDATVLDDPAGLAFHAVGRVSLARCEIAGAVSLRRAHFERRLDEEPRAGQPAPNCLKLNDARIVGYLDLDGARFTATFDAGEGMRERAREVSVEARGLEVEGLVWLSHEIAGGTDCRLLLEGVRVGKALNHPRSSWPQPGRLAIDGLRYDKLELWKADQGRGGEPGVWRDWLALQFADDGGGAGGDLFGAQPHAQLIAVLRSMGLSGEARRLAIDKREREIDALPRWARWLYRLLLRPIGYGYRPWAALKYLTALYVLGVALFSLGWHVGAFQPAPVDVLVQQHLENAHPDRYADVHALPAEAYPEFDAFVYSADTFLPFVDLHQEAYWLPRRQVIVGQRPDAPFYLAAPCWVVDNWCRIYLWVHIATGWLLVTITIAGLTGIVKTD